MAGNFTTNLNRGGASPTSNPPTLDTNQHLKNIQRSLLPLKTYFESLANCVSTIPTPIIWSFGQDRQRIPAIGSEQSHDQPLVPAKATPIRQKHNEQSSNFRGHSTTRQHLLNFVLAKSDPATLKASRFEVAHLHSRRLDHQDKDIILSCHRTTLQPW
jgi:hypothetical protein